MKRIAVVLSGCGFQDGTEITEAVSSFIALTELGVDYEVFAPNTELSAKNHLTGESQGQRDVMAESARISRGNCKDIKELKPENFDGILFPGGFGAALNLSNWAQKGSDCEVNGEVKTLIQNFHSHSKPIAALCIAPAVIAKVLGEHNVAVTIGTDKDTAAEIEKTGASHVDCAVTDFVTDREHKVITTPAYMYGDAKPFEIYTGVRKAIHEFVEMA